jgi:hypothetical protein
LASLKRKLGLVEAGDESSSESSDEEQRTGSPRLKLMKSVAQKAKQQKRALAALTDGLSLQYVGDGEGGKRSVRESTKTKVEVGEINRTLFAKPKIKYRPPVVHQYSQKELLQEALETEVLIIA